MLFHVQPVRYSYSTRDDWGLYAPQRVHSHSTVHYHKCLLDDKYVAEGRQGTVTTLRHDFVQELREGEENYDYMSVGSVGSCLLYRRHCGSYLVAGTLDRAKGRHSSGGALEVELS